MSQITSSVESKVCGCPHDSTHCPHCGNVIDAVMGRAQSHRDRCHRAAVGSDRA